MEKSGTDLEALLGSQFIQNPYPYHSHMDILASYSFEPPESADSVNLREQVKHALGNAWKYDPIRCSVKAAFQVAQHLVGRPNHGLTKEEYTWTTGAKVTTVRRARSEAPVDFEQARKHNEWMKNMDENDKDLDIHQELDDFYGPDGTDLRPIDNDSSDEGFYEPTAIAHTVVSLPDKSLMEEGITPGGIFQDSGIVMDEAYAEYSHAHSVPNTAKELTATVPSDWPTFDVDIALRRPPKQKSRWLGLVGDQKQCDWPGRRESPYDLYGLCSSIRAAKSNQVEILVEPEIISKNPQGMVETFTPQSVTREASVGPDVVPTSLPISPAVAEAQDANQTVDGSNFVVTHENPLPAEVTSPIKLVQRAQVVSEPMQGRVNGEPSEATTQPSLLHGNNENGRHIAIPETISHTFVINKDAADKEASVGAAQSLSEERPQHFPGSIENGSDNELSAPTPHVTRGVPQMDIDTDVHASRGVPTTAFPTPANQRIHLFQRVQVDTPATPATININLIPECNNDMDADDASAGSLAVRQPSSPTTYTQKGQSALDRYVEETQSHPHPAGQSSSTISLAASESEEVSLIPTQECPSQSEDHAGFSKSVELHRKMSDAAFTLSPSKASRQTPSSGKTAPIPITPSNGHESASFRPMTPFQLGTPARPDFDSPGTPTPAPKARKADTNSVMNVFKSSKLGSRSPERARPSPEIVVAPTTPTAEAANRHTGSPFGSQGLLFHKTKRNERDTKNVLNSLKLSSERGSGCGTSKRDSQEDYEDELARGKNFEAYKSGKWVQDAPSMLGSRIDLGVSGGRKVAQAVVVPSVRPRDDNDGIQTEDLQIEEPRKKKLRRSMRAGAGADVPDAGPFSEH